MENNDFTDKKKLKKHKNLLSHIKMGKEIINFVNIETEKIKFYCHRSLIF